jgi:hypothetical protein
VLGVLGGLHFLHLVIIIPAKHHPTSPRVHWKKPDELEKAHSY